MTQTLFEQTFQQPTAKSVGDVLASLPLFERLSRELRRIAAHAKIREYANGDVVVQAGQRGSSFYVILGGRARVLGRPKARVLRTGDYFGEMALLDGEPRSATIVAAGELQTMELSRTPFLRVLEQEPRIALALMAELAARVRRLEKTRDL
jgi:CRP-like cAMP-binding protein